MTRLAITSTILGLVIIAARAPGIFVPAKVRAIAQQIPRSVLLGRIVMAIVAAWAGIVLYGAATEDWAWAQPVIVIGVPVAYWLVIQYAGQFLALRAIAALSLLLAKIVLDAADTSDEPVRLVITVLAYLWVLAAAWMAIAPHQIRDVIGWVSANDTRTRTVCVAGTVVGVALVALGLFVY